MENLRFSRATLTFGRCFWMLLYPDVVGTMGLLSMEVSGVPLDWQVASAAQIINSLRTLFSSVENLILEYTYTNSHLSPLGWTNEVNLSQWRELLRSFNNLKVLRVPRDFIRALSRSLASMGGEFPVELLPELKELSSSGSGDDGDAFTSFVVSRQNTGHTVSLVHRLKSTRILMHLVTILTISAIMKISTHTQYTSFHRHVGLGYLPNTYCSPLRL